MLIGNRIRDLRIERNLSQQELADILSVTKVSICGYEIGKRTSSLETFILLADYFGVSTDYLLGRTDNIDVEEDNISKGTREEVNIIKEIKNYPSLYSKFLKSPKRYTSLVYNKLK